MMTHIRSLGDLLPNHGLDECWNLYAYSSDECVSYIAWNTRTSEALIIDPKAQDIQAYRKTIQELNTYRWLAVIDTHTHADHVSIAAQLANEVNAPYLMHAACPSLRVQIRIAHDTHFTSEAGPIEFLFTPGHTADSLTVRWGKFVFTGDTILFGDTGRDDLPGGSAEAHYESIVKLKARLSPDLIILPGHDREGGRASTWAHQLDINPSLKETRETFVSTSNAFEGPAPRYLKESLRENFK